MGSERRALADPRKLGKLRALSKKVLRLPLAWQELAAAIPRSPDASGHFDRRLQPVAMTEQGLRPVEVQRSALGSATSFSSFLSILRARLYWYPLLTNVCERPGFKPVALFTFHLGWL